MEYTAKNVETPRGLSQEQALEGLQRHEKFVAGSVIASIRQRGDRWNIKVLEPKIAEFPPKDEEKESEEPSVVEPKESESDSEGEDKKDDSPFPTDDSESEDKKEPKGELGEVLELLHQVVDALGIGDPAGDLLGPDGPVDGPPAPPPSENGHGGARPGAGHPPGPPKPKPGGPEGPLGPDPISGFASVQAMAEQIPTFTATAEGRISAKEAKTELEQQYGPHYKVKQVKREGDKTSALLSVR